MERGFDQLVIVLLVVLATLLDLVLRWIKKRTRHDESPVHRDETVAAEDAEAEPWESEWQPLPEAPLPEAPPREALPPEAPPPEVPPQEAPGREVPPWREPAREVPRLRRPLFERAGDARRAIVVMAVLGPCRALDPASRDVISER